MRGGWWALILGVVSLSSCGLETVESLDAPFDDNYYNSILSTRRLSFEHSGAKYDGTSFFGYLVYYKIYPNSSTEDLARLQLDRDELGTGTVNKLVSMGYSSLTRSRAKDSSSSSGLDELLIDNLSSGDEVAVDFTELLRNADGQPVLQVNGALPAAPYLYRTMALAGSADQKFSTLRTAPARKTDMAAMSSEQLSAREYEITLFVVAYGLDAKLNEVYSKPAPWGIIRKIAPISP